MVDTSDYQKHLDAQLKEFQDSLDQKLSVYKDQIQSSLNDSMLQHIKEAEEAIEKARKSYTDSYKEEMEEIRQKRESGGISMMLDIREEFSKEMFKNNLNSVVNMWLKFIKDCESNMQ